MPSATLKQQHSQTSYPQIQASLSLLLFLHSFWDTWRVSCVESEYSFYCTLRLCTIVVDRNNRRTLFLNSCHQWMLPAVSLHVASFYWITVLLLTAPTPHSTTMILWITFPSALFAHCNGYNIYILHFIIIQKKIKTLLNTFLFLGIWTPSCQVMWHSHLHDVAIGIRGEWSLYHKPIEIHYKTHLTLVSLHTPFLSGTQLSLSALTTLPLFSFFLYLSFSHCFNISNVWSFEFPRGSCVVGGVGLLCQIWWAFQPKLGFRPFHLWSRLYQT